MAPPDAPVEPQGEREERPPDLSGDARPSAEERTTEAAAGAPAGDRDLDELLDDPEAPSG